MLINGFLVVARRRWLVLSGVLLLAVVLGIAAEAREPQFWLPASVTMLTLVGIALLLSTLALRYRPAALTVPRHGQAFIAPAPQQVFQAAAFTLLGGLLVSDKVGDVINREWLRPVDAILATMWVLLVATHWNLAIGDYGLRLRPDGVLNRQLIGSQFVPWDAFVPACPVSPAGTGLALNLQRPELVRRRGIGFSRNTLQATIDPAYLTRLIHEYVNHPERRAAIGTESELRRVTEAAP